MPKSPPNTALRQAAYLIFTAALLGIITFFTLAGILGTGPEYFDIRASQTLPEPARQFKGADYPLFMAIIALLYLPGHIVPPFAMLIAARLLIQPATLKQAVIIATASMIVLALLCAGLLAYEILFVTTLEEHLLFIRLIAIYLFFYHLLLSLVTFFIGVGSILPKWLYYLLIIGGISSFIMTLLSMNFDLPIQQYALHPAGYTLANIGVGVYLFRQS